MDTVDEAEVFQGSDNMITMIQIHSKKFHCTYLLHDFPFDTQVCYVHMILRDFDQETIQLVPDQLVMESPLQLTQYNIQEWQLEYYDEGIFWYFGY